MLENYTRFTRWLTAFLLALAGTLAAEAVILALPKALGFAATSRLILVVAFGAIGIAGLIAALWTWRRLSEARLALRLTGAPRPILVSAQFLTDEPRKAWAGLIPILALILAAQFLRHLALWPQLAALAPWRPLLGGMVAILGTAALGLLVMRRTSFINARWLAAAITQQAHFADFTPLTLLGAWHRVRQLKGPLLQREGDGVRIGGTLFHFSDFGKGVLLTGQTGSGKSNFLGLLTESVFMMHEGKQPFSMLVQDLKGDWLPKIRALCAKYGRSGDLYVIGLEGDPATLGAQDNGRYNPVHNSYPVMEVAANLGACFRHLGMKGQDFFTTAAVLFVAPALTLLRAGLPDGEVPTVQHLYRLAHEVPRPDIVTPDGEVIESNAPPTFYEELCMRIAGHHPDRSRLPEEVGDAFRYFETEYYPAPPRQRAGVASTLSQLTAELASPPLRDITCGATTLPIEQLVREGKILVIHARAAKFPRGSLILQTLAKKQFFYSVLEGRGKPVPSVYLADEYDKLISTGIGGDADFFALARESNHASFVAAQNIVQFNVASGDKNQTYSILGNLALKFFFRNTEPETVEFASRLFGEASNIQVSQSEAASFGHLWRRTRTTYSKSSTVSRRVPPEQLTTLAVPVEGQRAYSEAIGHAAQRPETERLDIVAGIYPL